MGLLLGLELDFNPDVLAPGIVLGIAAAGLYGLLAISFVLTYRVSRTIGFVQAGIALFTVYLFGWLTYDTAGGAVQIGADQRMGRVEGTLVCVAVGALIGVAYGYTVTGRKLANWPRINLTTYSLAWLLLLFGFQATLFEITEQKQPSVFGTGTVTLFDAVVTHHQVATLGILVALVLGLSYVLLRTQAGINIRAIADDVEACRLVGVALNKVGTGVYAFAGALAGLAGVLLSSQIGTNPYTIIVIFLRALTVSVLGGMTSFSLALGGCVLIGIAENTAQAGLFGNELTDVGTREIVIVSILFLLVFLINRLRPIRAVEASGL